METEIFLARCHQIEKGLHRLTDDLYESMEDGTDGPERDELVKLAEEKIQLYDVLYAELEDDDERKEVQSINRYIVDLKDYIKQINSGS